MQLKEIFEFKDLKNYCNRKTKYSNNSNNSGSINFEIFTSPIDYYGVDIKGVIKSYDTPIGYILPNSLIIMRYQGSRMFSVTTDNILRILSKNIKALPRENITIVAKTLNLEMGWL